MSRLATRSTLIVAVAVCAAAIVIAYRAIATIAPIVAATTPQTDAQAIADEPHPSDVGLLP